MFVLLWSFIKEYDDHSIPMSAGELPHTLAWMHCLRRGDICHAQRLCLWHRLQRNTIERTWRTKTSVTSNIWIDKHTRKVCSVCLDFIINTVSRWSFSVSHSIRRLLQLKSVPPFCNDCPYQLSLRGNCAQCSGVHICCSFTMPKCKNLTPAKSQWQAQHCVFCKNRVHLKKFVGWKFTGCNACSHLAKGSNFRDSSLILIHQRNDEPTTIYKRSYASTDSTCKRYS